MQHQTFFNIRTFHTDAFGHVNNARYLEILEEARWRYAEDIGLVELLKSSQLGFIIMDLRIRFRRPVAEGDAIAVTTQLVTLGSASGGSASDCNSRWRIERRDPMHVTLHINRKRKWPVGTYRRSNSKTARRSHRIREIGGWFLGH